MQDSYEERPSIVHSLRRAGPPLRPEATPKVEEERIQELVRETEELLKYSMSGDLHRIAHSIFNLRYGLMIQLATEIHEIRPDRSATSPEELAKDFYQWAENMVQGEAAKKGNDKVQVVAR